MHFLYSIFIQFYGLLVHFASLFNEKAEKWTSGRKNWQIDLSHKIDKNQKYCWIHCASAGEFEQAIPLIKELRIENKGQRIAVSFFSSSGFEMYKDSKSADVFFYIPLDTKKNANHLIEILNPIFVIFIRNEIWLNVLSALEEKNIPSFLVNANIHQKRSFIYQKYLDKTYPLFTAIFDTKTYGNTKLEKVISNKEEIYSDEILEDFCKDSFVIILGSSRKVEESLIALFHKKYCLKYPNLKIIIAPHNFDKNRELELVKIFTDWQTPNINEIISYSTYKPLNSQFKILFLDKKGILKYAYRYANVAIIGGGFSNGIHNITEAAVYGIPTIFGWNYQKFEEVTELVNLQVAFPVNDYESMEKKLLEFITTSAIRSSIKEKSDAYFSVQKIIAVNIINKILLLVKKQ